jgi:Flp pilus assembly protein TadB
VVGLNRTRPRRDDAVAHEMARKNGTTPGAFNPIFIGLALLAALVMAVVDARGRPVLASVAYSLTVFVTVSATLARMPAFAQSLPSVPETALAAAVTVLAGLAGGGVLATRLPGGDDGVSRIGEAAAASAGER